MVDVEDVLGSRREIPVVMVNGKTFKIAYDPNKITLKELNEQQKKLDAAEDGAKLPVVAENLSYSLVDWELTRGGAPIPVDAASIATVALPILNAVQSAIEEDQKKLGETTFSTVTSRPSRN